MASFTVNAGVTDTAPKSVSNNDVGTIASGGTLTATTAITWTGGSNTPGVLIDNSGTINGATRAIDSSGAFAAGGSITVNNNAGAFITATGNDGWRINNSLNAGGTVTLNNAGTITSNGGQALDFGAITSSTATVQINNAATGIIRSNAADAIRPGSNATVNNYGQIFVMNPDGDGIDFQQNTNGTVNNFAGGSVTGARHGITGDEPITVNNAGSITGTLGSGINMDTASTTTTAITNSGTITGNAAGAVDGDSIDVDGLATIENHGLIQAFGTSSAGLTEAITIGGGVINNYAGGTIVSVQRAINVDDSADPPVGPGPAYSAVTVYNEGLIEGGNGEAIVILGTFGDTITNLGTIVGSVATGGGDDALSLFTGSSIGAIDGGADSDTIDLSGAGQGTLTSFTNVEFIDLNGGDWTLGSDGVTRLAFQSGAQTLRLQTGVLTDGDFDGTIDNFTAGDVIDLAGIGLATGATLGAGNLLTITGGTLGPITLQLDASDDYTGQVFRLASDGMGGTNVTVAVDLAPVFTSPAAFSVAENSTLAGTVTADDPEDDAFTFALAGGADAAFFTIDATTGALSFISAPDFETPEDAGGNNVYDVNVAVTDAYGASSMQMLSVTVTNLAEPGQTIKGGNGNDTLNGTTGNDKISGGNGHDTINGRDGNDLMSGDNGNDFIFGGRGNDVIEGGNGDDTLDGGSGNNALDGGNGNDTMTAGHGNNLMIGGNGNDKFTVGNGNNILIGGNGNDTFTLGDGNNIVTGNNGNDVFLAGNGDNIIIAGSGNDKFTVGDGDNLIAGGGGNDVFRVGSGDNTLSGGSGGDTFVFAAGFGENVITDFGRGDRIQFEAGVFANFAAVQAATQQVGADTVISLGADHSITLEHTRASSLHASDFLFS